jgi:hypothetical protein
VAAGFTTTVNLPPGRWQYKYVVTSRIGGAQTWVVDGSQPKAQQNGFGG